MPTRSAFISRELVVKTGQMSWTMRGEPGLSYAQFIPVARCAHRQRERAGIMPFGIHGTPLSGVRLLTKTRLGIERA